MNLFTKIKNLKNAKEAREFIENRLIEINNNEKGEIGLTTSVSVYDKFVNPNLKVITDLDLSASYEKVNIKSTGSIVFNDPIMYWYLVDAVKVARDPYQAVYVAVKNYFSLEKTGNDTPKKMKKRELIFKRFSKKNIPVPIKKISSTKIARCPERAGAAHNMFKFLGIDCDYIINGYGIVKNKPGYHCFNVVYPDGRDKYAIVLDTSCDCGGMYPSMYYLDCFKRSDLFNNKEVTFKARDLQEAFKRAVFLKATAKETEDKYLIFKDGYPETLIEYEHPGITKKLALKRE